MSKNFFQLYHDYVKSTEPPPNFHAWSAISAISALLGKKCFIPQGDFTVYPQLYVILVGEPGTRKSTAMGIAKKLVKTVTTVPVAPESATRESLIDDMAGHPVGEGKRRYWQSSVFVDELKDFVGGRHINQSMIGFLTTIWDGDIYKEATRGGGEKVIHNPYLTMLACCNPSWITTSLKQDVLTEGFSRRGIFQMQSMEDMAALRSWPVKTPEQVEMWPYLQNECKRIHMIDGQFTLSQKAFNLYDTEYLRIRDDMKKHTEKVQAYFSSKHVLALKLAMCISAAQRSSRMVNVADVSAAFSFLGQAERTLDAVFAGVGRNELKGFADQILTKIRLSGAKGLSKGDLLRGHYDNVNKIELDEIVNMLSESKQIHIGSPTGAQASTAEVRLTAIGIETLPPAVNLLELISRLEEHDEPKMVEILPYVEPRHLAPETVQFLTRQEDRRKQTASGILLKGKSAQAPVDTSTILETPAL